MGSTKMIFLVALVVLILFVKDIESCHCPPMSYQDSFCFAPFAIKGFVQIDDAPVDIDNIRIRGMYSHYTVHIEQVFKNQGDDAIGEGKDITLSVPFGSSMCGMTLTQGRHYFMTGFIQQSGRERYQVNACDWTQFYDTMSPQQVDGILGGYRCSA